MTKANKIIGLEELKKYDWYPKEPKKLEPKKSFWKKLVEYFNVNKKLRLENIHLNDRLTGALFAAEEAGKTGLSMYYENEQLKAQLDIAQRSCDPSVFNNVWVRKEELDRAKNEIKILNDRCNRLNHQFDDMNALRIEATLEVEHLQRELDGKNGAH